MDNCFLCAIVLQWCKGELLLYSGEFSQIPNANTTSEMIYNPDIGIREIAGKGRRNYVYLIISHAFI